MEKGKVRYTKERRADSNTVKSTIGGTSTPVERQVGGETSNSILAQTKQSTITKGTSRRMGQAMTGEDSDEIISNEVLECIKDSLDCFRTCTETITQCLKLGEEYVEQRHLTLLTDCAKICSTNADFTLRNSPYYPQLCGVTADICDECADNCEKYEDDFLKQCASICRRCAESCREMAR